jgi:hypothetical protein
MKKIKPLDVSTDLITMKKLICLSLLFCFTAFPALALTKIQQKGDRVYFSDCATKDSCTQAGAKSGYSFKDFENHARTKLAEMYDLKRAHANEVGSLHKLPSKSQYIEDKLAQLKSKMITGYYADKKASQFTGLDLVITSFLENPKVVAAPVRPATPSEVDADRDNGFTPVNESNR